MDHYKTLGIDENASDEKIKKAYRKLAKKYHPDVNKEAGSEEQFKKISEAYEILIDPKKKQKYDYSRKSGASHFDIFNDIRNHYSSPFDNNGFGFDFRRPMPKKGSSLNINMQLNLHDVLNGVEKKIRIKRQKRCGICNGDGGISHQTCGVCNGTGFTTHTQNRGFTQVNSIQPCTTCNGTGKVILEVCLDCMGKGLVDFEDVIDLKIPAGAADGMQFIIENKGNESHSKGGKNGDLLVKIKEISHPDFIRRGIDLFSVREITFLDAVLGTNIEVKVPSGEILTAVIDPGTLSGTTLKFSQKGIPNLGYGAIGDFLVQITIKIPKDLSEEDKKFLEELKNNEVFK